MNGVLNPCFCIRRCEALHSTVQGIALPNAKPCIKQRKRLHWAMQKMEITLGDYTAFDVYFKFF